jgi:nucleoside-diphosphate-sugar epimerase
MIMDTASRKVLVTGGTGFVGSHLVEILVRKGYDVTCLVRDRSKLRWLEGLKVRLIEGDCSLPDSLAAAVQNTEIVYHVAGLTKAYRTREYYEVNHLGTRNLLDIYTRHGPGLGKFVLVSSLAAAGPGSEGHPVTDRDPPHPVSDYGKSKLLAEEEALRYKDRFTVVILRPSAVYGPRDIDVYELFRWAAKGLIVDLQGGERFLNWCYVDDLVETLLLAGERTLPSGAVYFVAEDRRYSTTEFHDALQRTGGVTARVIRIPVWMGYAIGAASETAGFLVGKATIMNRQKVREAVEHYWTCDLEKTHRDLGTRARTTLEDGLTRTWKWYRENGWIR